MTLNLKRIKRLGGPGSDDLQGYLAQNSGWAAGVEAAFTALATALDTLQTQHNALATAVAELQTQHNATDTAANTGSAQSVSDVAATASAEDFAAALDGATVPPTTEN